MEPDRNERAKKLAGEIFQKFLETQRKLDDDEPLPELEADYIVACSLIIGFFVSRLKETPLFSQLVEETGEMVKQLCAASKDNDEDDQFIFPESKARH